MAAVLGQAAVTDSKTVISVLASARSGPGVWRVLAGRHDRRNRGRYARNLYAGERLITDLMNACKIVAATVHACPSVM
jgi:hypothetical protein